MITPPEVTACAEETLIVCELSRLLDQHTPTDQKQLTIELYRQGLISYNVMQCLFDTLDVRGA